jgi:hypothetical protein
LEGLVTIPRVDPGDTVWWHPGKARKEKKEKKKRKKKK